MRTSLRICMVVGSMLVLLVAGTAVQAQALPKQAFPAPGYGVPYGAPVVVSPYGQPMPVYVQPATAGRWQLPAYLPRLPRSRGRRAGRRSQRFGSLRSAKKNPTRRRARSRRCRRRPFSRTLTKWTPAGIRTIAARKVAATSASAAATRTRFAFTANSCTCGPATRKSATRSKRIRIWRRRAGKHRPALRSRHLRSPCWTRTTRRGSGRDLASAWMPAAKSGPAIRGSILPSRIRSPRTCL